MRAQLLRLVVGVSMGVLIWSTPGLAHDHQSEHDHSANYDRQPNRDPGGVYDHPADHERAREAYAAGEAMSLQEILSRVEQSYPGRLLKVEFERDDGVWVYKLRILQNQGRMLKLKVDARDATVLAVRGRPAHNPEKWK